MSEKIEKDEETQQQIMDFLSTCYEYLKSVWMLKVLPEII